jgi:hypothetical protein
VPGSVEHIVRVLVEYGPIAAGTRGNRRWHHLTGNTIIITTNATAISSDVMAVVVIVIAAA